MTVIETLLKRVEKGMSFSCDFKNKNLKVGKTYLVKDGAYKGEYGFLPCEALSHIEDLYEKYKHSAPSEDSHHWTGYFKALPAEELSLQELVGCDRELARAELESYILGLSLSGFSWDKQPELKGKWFHQGKDPDLVIFKDWF